MVVYLSQAVFQEWNRQLGYTLSLPGVHSCIIAAESVQQLEENIKVARLFTALEATEMEENRTTSC